MKILFQIKHPKYFCSLAFITLFQLSVGYVYILSRPGTAIDEEAKNRCTSVYLSDKRIDMVPTLLSSNLCSLREGVERFAFSVIWQLDQDANIKHTKVTEDVILNIMIAKMNSVFLK